VAAAPDAAQAPHRSVPALRHPRLDHEARRNAGAKPLVVDAAAHADGRRGHLCHRRPGVQPAHQYAGQQRPPRPRHRQQLGLRHRLAAAHRHRIHADRRRGKPRRADLPGPDRRPPARRRTGRCRHCPQPPRRGRSSTAARRPRIGRHLVAHRARWHCTGNHRLHQRRHRERRYGRDHLRTTSTRARRFPSDRRRRCRRRRHHRGEQRFGCTRRQPYPARQWPSAQPAADGARFPRPADRGGHGRFRSRSDHDDRHGHRAFRTAQRFRPHRHRRPRQCRRHLSARRRFSPAPRRLSLRRGGGCQPAAALAATLHQPCARALCRPDRTERRRPVGRHSRTARTKPLRADHGRYRPPAGGRSGCGAALDRSRRHAHPLRRPAPCRRTGG
jgi:hypothetical protein